MIELLENLPCEETLKELDLFSLEKRMPMGMSSVFRWLQRGLRLSLHKGSRGEDKEQQEQVALGEASS